MLGFHGSRITGTYTRVTSVRSKLVFLKNFRRLRVSSIIVTTARIMAIMYSVISDTDASA